MAAIVPKPAVDDARTPPHPYRDVHYVHAMCVTEDYDIGQKLRQENYLNIFI